MSDWSGKTHTPGPWHQSHHPDDGVFGGPPGNMICRCTGSGTLGTLAQTSANARLIAAAPELLDALEEMVSVFVEEFGDLTEEPDDSPVYAGDKDTRLTFGLMRRASAVIAKAKGET